MFVSCAVPRKEPPVYIWLKTPKSCKALHNSDAETSYLILADGGQSWGKMWLSEYSILPPQCNAHPALGIVRRFRYKGGNDTSVAIGDSFSFFLELLPSAFTGEQRFNPEPDKDRCWMHFVCFLMWAISVWWAWGDPSEGGYYGHVHIVRSADWFMCILRLSDL